VWLAIAAIPPLLAIVTIVIPRLKSRVRDTTRSSERALDALEHEFRQALFDLVGEVERSGGNELSAALRAAGIDAPIASHAARVRERMWQANYGPDREVDPEELTAEVNEVLKALAGTVAGVALVLVCLAGTSADLSAQSAERLYEAGALRAAADSFARRAEAEPWVVSHWYNLGATWERVGENERARRAWIRAARISPRNDRVRTALHQLPHQDNTSNRITRISPITPAEAFIAAACVWIVAWIGIALRLRRLFTIPACLVALVLAAFGLQVAKMYSAPVALVLSPEVPLRTAPYGPAQPMQFLAEGAAVRVSRIEGPWMLVERGDDSGWLLQEEVVALQ
jgi:hypothetical protein